jgi:multidrug efflux pump subunit AcrA (membrane-fusion protein)
MPGELNPYQSVAIYPRVTGFVKIIRVDRGSRLRAGDLITELEAPELTAQRSGAIESPERRSTARRSPVES